MHKDVRQAKGIGFGEVSTSSTQSRKVCLPKNYVEYHTPIVTICVRSATFLSVRAAIDP